MQEITKQIIFSCKGEVELLGMSLTYVRVDEDQSVDEIEVERKMRSPVVAFHAGGYSRWHPKSWQEKGCRNR